jgi:hypothetical protein
MAAYNVTLIQDVTEYIGYIEPNLQEILKRFNVSDYQHFESVVEWIIREEIEVMYGLSGLEYADHVLHQGTPCV